MSAHEELERQLLQSVAARSWARTGPAASLARRWRAPDGRRGAVAALVVALALGAALVAGVGTHRRAGDAGSSTLHAGVSNSQCALCRTFRGQLHGPMISEQASAEARGGGLSARERRGLSVVVWSRSLAKT